MIVSNMIDKLKHRGPDGTEVYADNCVGLGFSRLSIIDLEGGMQPIWNEDRTIVMVCNGEIFNYKELRLASQSKGHIFRTNTDVEVIIHLYEEHGTSFLNKLNGQFAFALYDLKEKRMFCARDQVGIAPFYYTFVDGMFIFGSEIKAILEHPSVGREVDLVSLDQILALPSIVSPRTIFKNISSLPSGHYMTICEGASPQIYEYWDLIYPKLDEALPFRTEAEYIEKVDELLTKAVSMRLQSDVTVGMYLSGGLDSSIICSKVIEISSSPRTAFSVDFAAEDYSESRFQRIMIDHLKLEHVVELCDVSRIVDGLSSAVYHAECILKETYDTASLLLSNAARKNQTKVILTGEGADELFAGYMSYKFDKIRNKSGNVYQNDEKENIYRQKMWGNKHFFYEKYYAQDEVKRRQLYSSRMNEKFESFNFIDYPIINSKRIQNIDPLHQRSYVDFKTRLPDHLLSDHGDRVTFANSVEARYPFLDKDLIEYVRLMPTNMKLKGMDGKYTLKMLAESLVPKEIIKRPKTPFAAPGSPEILRYKSEHIESILSYDTIKRQGYFDPDQIESLKKRYSSDSFRLKVPYEEDLLMPVITFGMLIEQFKLPDL
ncbi:asparagine synthase (glutamine-hydrolyzing) [Paenibacillus xylanexedens]|uniref:asparagine synthase (glutamine-hydrolyzing) n=1 Tax=Paenibacillus xylanexedens TaxID=528191 RepID=UPI000A44EE23|nr:asparagine synthase (glutamine-hydrolyzing) [Paenibacillus xylanexedens]